MNDLLLPTDSKFMDVAPELVLQVAAGAVDEAQLARAYGYTPEEWVHLNSLPHFQKEVAAKRTELDASGYTRALKTALKYDVLSDRNYALMLASDDMALRLKYQRQLAEEANLMPKLTAAQNDPNAALGRLTISIEIPGKPTTTLVGAETSGNTYEAEEVQPVKEDAPKPPPPPPLAKVLNTDLYLPQETF